MRVPDPRPDNLRQAYAAAYSKACEELRRWDPADMAASSGAGFDSAANTFSLIYGGQRCQVSYPSGEVTYADSAATVPNTERIILLHYLVRSAGRPPAGHWISFKELPAVGMLYLDPFNKRVTNYLLAVFGHRPQLLSAAGEILGASAVSCGDFGVRLDILPRLPVIYALWAADEEFGPRATVLFDATAPLYLPTEDLIVTAGFGVTKLAQACKQLQP